ncbi:MAG: hypothetical protein B0W54_21625 [Cellvibrio sp. 79]|nr:MAG: hypothetical protein B0W54_21625 [Cellvibrio sp. 79]
MKLVDVLKTGVFILGALVGTQVALAETPATLTKNLPELQKLGENPVLVAAVKAQNAKAVSLDAIKKRDAEWMAKTGVDEGMKALMENEPAKELAKIESSQPYYFELFLMDNQGANVAMTNKTSDYWQGDEDKFKSSFKGGSGAVFVAEPEFDDSAKAYLIQVSVPVVDAGKAIGVLTIGVNLDELEAAQ